VASVAHSEIVALFENTSGVHGGRNSPSAEGEAEDVMKNRAAAIPRSHSESNRMATRRSIALLHSVAFRPAVWSNSHMLIGGAILVAILSDRADNTATIR
jgi:hypothetical protein